MRRAAAVPRHIARCARLSGMLFLLVAPGAWPGCAARPPQPAPPPASPGFGVPGAGGVRVDGQVVSARTVWNEYYAQRAVKGMIHGRGEQQSVDEAQLADVISQQVSRVLLDREAGRLGYVIAPAEEAGIRAAEVAKWGSEEKFLTALRMLALTEEHQLAKARSAALRRKLAEGEGATRALTFEEERRYYDEHLERFLSREKPRLRYIFSPRTAGVDAQTFYREILLEADAARRQSRSYAEVVARRSVHASAPGGGLVDETAAERLPFQPASLKPCRVSQLAYDEAGIHLYLRDCVMPVPFEEARDQVGVLSRKEREDRFLSDLLERLKAAARIEYLPLEGEAPLPSAREDGHGEAPLLR